MKHGWNKIFGSIMTDMSSKIQTDISSKYKDFLQSHIYLIIKLFFVELFIVE